MSELANILPPHPSVSRGSCILEAPLDLSEEAALSLTAFPSIDPGIYGTIVSFY